MSIRIIDDNPHHSVIRRCVCRHCGVTLEYTPNDAREVTILDYTGDSDTYYEINCVKCGNSIRNLK